MHLGVPLSHFAVEQKLAQHYKSAILQQINKIPKQNKTRWLWRIITLLQT